VAKNLSDKPIAAADLSEFVRDHDDFSFELEVLSVTQGLGFPATHAGSYEDPVTGKPRQFDIRAKIDSGDGALRLRLAIECKRLAANFPLLVSRVPRPADDSYHSLISGASVHRSIKGSCAFVEFSADTFYPKKELVGKSMRQVGRDTKGEITSSDAEVFDKWMQAIASAGEIIETEVAWHRPRRAPPTCWSFILPILVVPDKTLWVADYSANGQKVEAPREVSDTTFYVGRWFDFPNEEVEYCVTHMQIVTQAGYIELLRNLQPNGQAWKSIFNG
jgi:hypothetical protein